MKPRVKPTGRVFVVHDVHGGPKSVSQPKPIIRASLPPVYGYSHRKTGAPKTRAVFEHMEVFGIRTRI